EALKVVTPPRYSRTEGRLCTNENSFRIHSKTTGWFCNVHSRTTPATIFSAVLRSINAPRKSATIKTTTIWFFSDIGFSFLTASEVVLRLRNSRVPESLGASRRPKSPLFKKPDYSSSTSPSLRSVPRTGRYQHGFETR